jgi:hypothetical protein
VIIDSSALPAILPTEPDHATWAARCWHACSMKPAS